MHSSSNPLLLADRSDSLESRRLASLCAASVSQARSILSLLLIWMLVCQTMMLGAPHYWRSQGEPGSRSASDAPALFQTIESPLTRDDANSSLSSTFSSVADGIAIVRHAPAINGNGKVEGSLRQLTGESVTLNGGIITEDLQVPGTPTLFLNGNPAFGGTIQGAGNSEPTNYQVTLNGGGATLGHLVTRTDPMLLPSVPAPPASTGTRSVTINSPDENPGDFATLLDLTLNGNAGMVPVIPGTYRNLIAHGGSGFVLGSTGSMQPAIYNLDSLTLPGQSRIEIVGPVNLTVGSGLSLNASMGEPSQPSWLSLQIASGGVTLNGGSALNGIVKAPSGPVIINGNAQLVGTVACDRLTINGGGLLRLTESALPPVNNPPVVSAGSNQTITLPHPSMLNGSVDDGLPARHRCTEGWLRRRISNST